MVYLFALIAIFTASFREFFIICFLVIIHEIGHFMMAFFLGCEIDKIYIYPMGGISKFKMDLNIGITSEFLILLMGPIFQMIAFNILVILMPKYYQVISIYNYGILIFNLLPVYPLDGGKLVSLILQSKYPFKKSLIVTFYISYFIVLVLFLINLYSFSINLFIIVMFLLYKVNKEEKEINYLYERFLLERYLNNYKFRKGSIVDDISKLKRGRHHLIRIENRYYFEEEILEKKYKKC